jgi:hypothetical protein
MKLKKTQKKVEIKKNICRIEREKKKRAITVLKDKSMI